MIYLLKSGELQDCFSSIQAFKCLIKMGTAWSHLSKDWEKTFCNLNKHILQFEQIHLAVLTLTTTNTFLNLDKYNLHFNQIHLSIWTNMICNFDKYIPSRRSSCLIKMGTAWSHSLNWCLWWRRQAHFHCHSKTKPGRCNSLGQTSR